MKQDTCPNYKECRLVKAPDFRFADTGKEFYLNNYCLSRSQQWLECKRLIAKNSLGFCPDFVLPDSTLTTDEIIDKFDNEI